MLADAEQPLLELPVRLEARRFHDAVDPAIDHDRDLLGDRGGDTDVLLDHEHADVALFTEVDQDLLDLVDDQRREALGRLVHHQQPRIEKQRTRDGQHLLLAAGELVASMVAPLRQPRESVVNARNRPLRPAGASREPQMLIDRERGP